MGWATGDFNGDGKVNINDLTIVLTHYNQSVGSSAGGMAAVPEPVYAGAPGRGRGRLVGTGGSLPAAQPVTIVAHSLLLLANKGYCFLQWLVA